MEKMALPQFYEKLYFHKIEAREKLNARLQTSLTLIIALIGVLAFLLQNYGHRDFSWAVGIFFFLICGAAVVLAGAIVYFVRAC